MEQIKVDGTNWTPSEVAKHKKEDFVKAMMAEPDVYAYMQKERKEANLKKAYEMCNKVK